MKISLNWLRRYIEIEKQPEEIGEILTSIGLEVEGIEEVESIKGGLKGIVVAEVLECGKHPNADKLSLCKVSIGNGQEFQVVCGAPNVAQGQKVLLATIGTKLYTKDGEEWIIKKGKIRGEFSEGMICAEDELGLGDDHSGIIVLEKEAVPGTPASQYYNLESDIVYEIGLTPNRSDATSHIGVAEDLAAYLKINENHSGALNYPSIEDFETIEGDGGFQVELLDVEGAPRYSGLLIKNLRIGESPDWIKNALRSIGINPKNNVVDITNYILHEMGQPLHAFDANKIAGNHIKVMTVPSDSKFLDLEGKTRKLHEEDCMICDGNEQGMCIGGVFGGLNSGVSEETTSIFLESAHFNAKRIRRTSTRHLLRTDAAVCFEKGSDPSGTVKALKRAALLMKEYAAGEFASRIFDIYPKEIQKTQVQISLRRINTLIGEEISKDEIISIFEALNFGIIKDEGDQMLIDIPTNKNDVTREADVIEEILRIYGYNKVGIPGKIVSTISNRPKPDLVALRNRAAQIFVGFGFSEMMAVSLHPNKYYSEENESELVYINNTSNVHLNVMRANLLYSALEAVEYNVNRQESALKLFEFGKKYWKDAGKIKETEQLSITLTGDVYMPSWLEVESVKESGFYYLKACIKELLLSFGIDRFQSSETSDPSFSYGLSYHRGPKSLVEFGMIDSKLRLAKGIKQDVYYAVINWPEIVKANGKSEFEMNAISKFPKVNRDLALILNQDIRFSQIIDISRNVNKKILQDISLFDVFVDAKKIGEGKKSYAISFEFQDTEKTLKDKQVDKIMNQLIQKFESELSAEIRR